jgi:hypothetical protein
VISNDAVHYINIAKAIKEGILPSETILYSPGYPIFIMFINFLIKNYILSSKLVSLLSGILLLIPLYLLAKDVSDRKVAIIAVILASFNPMLVDYSLSSLTESVYTFLFVALLYVFFSSFKNISFSNILLIGVISGLLYLVRPEGIMIFLLIIIILFYKNYQKKGNILKIGLVILVFFSFSFPYVLSLYLETGKWRISGKTMNLEFYPRYKEDDLSYQKRRFSLINDETKNSIERKDFSAFKYFLIHKKQFSLQYLKEAINIYYLIIPEVFPPLLFIFLGFGLLNIKNRIQMKKMLFLLFLFLQPVILVVLHPSDSRFFVPLIPLGLIFAGNGIIFFYNTVNDKLKNMSIISNSLSYYLFLFITVLFIFFQCLYPITSVIRNYRGGSYYEEHKNAGIYLRGIVKKEDVFASTIICAGFYAGGKNTILPFADVDEAIKWARKKNVKFLVIDERTIPSKRPALKELLDERNAQKYNLKVVYVGSGPNYWRIKSKIIVYEIL